MAAASLTAARLRELLHYCPEDGLFRWRLAGPRRIVGAVAGSRQRIGYIVIRLDGTLYYAHRLAWLHSTGSWPTATVDHQDGDKANNRWANLRDVSHAVNCANQHKAQGSAGMLGVVRNKRTKNWRSIITRDDRQTHLGTFQSPTDAHNAYLAERKRLDSES